MEDQERRALEMSYDNTQNWIRHFDNIVSGLNLFSATIVLGYIGLKLQGRRQVIDLSKIFILETDEVVEFLFLLAIVLIVLLITYKIDHECRRGFERIIRIEEALGLYAPNSLLNSSKPILDDYMKKSGSSSSFIYKLAYLLQSTLIILMVAFILVV
jgi:hypothetical protein